MRKKIRNFHFKKKLHHACAIADLLCKDQMCRESNVDKMTNTHMHHSEIAD